MNKNLVWIIVIVVLALAVFLIYNYWIAEEPLFNPAFTDVSVSVGNAAPIVGITALENPIPLEEGTTYQANIDFNVVDPNGIPSSNLNDLLTLITFQYPTGGPYTESRTASISDCTTPLDIGQVRTYDCTITMQYFDADGTWDVSVSVTDTSGATGTDTSTTIVGVLKHIILTGGAPISFGAVAPAQADVVPTPTTVTNTGNYEGTISVTAFALEEPSAAPDKIPAANFKSAGSVESNVCAGVSTTTLVQASATTIVSTSLPKGPAGSNNEDIKWCLDVPTGIISASYSTSVAPSQTWIIGI